MMMTVDPSAANGAKPVSPVADDGQVEAADEELARQLAERARAEGVSLTGPGGLAARYPSHLHINLLPRLQASGHGSELTKTLIADLRAQGSPGVHLHVPQGNRRAPGFYRHFGFTELSATSAELPAPDLRLFAMDLRNAA